MWEGDPHSEVEKRKSAGEADKLNRGILSRKKLEREEAVLFLNEIHNLI